MNTEEMMIRPVANGDILIREFKDGVYHVEIIFENTIKHRSFKNLLDVFKCISNFYCWQPGGSFDQQDNQVDMEKWLLSQTPDWNETVPNI
jgi:hypothetical protein